MANAAAPAVSRPVTPGHCPRIGILQTGDSPVAFTRQAREPFLLLPALILKTRAFLLLHPALVGKLLLPLLLHPALMRELLLPLLLYPALVGNLLLPLLLHPALVRNPLLPQLLEPPLVGILLPLPFGRALPRQPFPLLA